MNGARRAGRCIRLRNCNRRVVHGFKVCLSRELAECRCRDLQSAYRATLRAMENLLERTWFQQLWASQADYSKSRRLPSCADAMVRFKPPQQRVVAWSSVQGMGPEEGASGLLCIIGCLCTCDSDQRTVCLLVPSAEI